MPGLRFGIKARDIRQRDKADAAPPTHHLQPLRDEGAVEAGERHDIRHGRERDEIERRDEIRNRFALFPEHAVQRHQREEGHARRAESG